MQDYPVFAKRLLKISSIARRIIIGILMMVAGVFCLLFPFIALIRGISCGTGEGILTGLVIFIVTFCITPRPGIILTIEGWRTFQ